MTTHYYAQPYDLSATGFYFETGEEFSNKARTSRNAYGEAVEEFEVQLIDGERIYAELFRALSIHQGNVAVFIDRLADWDCCDKTALIVAVGECGYSFDPAKDDPSEYDIDLYEVESLRELAEQFVEDGLFGEVPEPFRFYIDYDAIAGDLAADYAEITIGGTRYAYRCG